MDSLKIEVRSLDVRRQETQSGKILHWQKVGLLQKDEFPLVFEVFREDGKPLPLGAHDFTPAFKTDNWNNLTVDAFNSKVTPAK